MSFFTALYNSLYNFKWLRNQRSNTSWAWGYFFLLIILVSGLSTITLGFKYFDTAPVIKKAVYNEMPEFQAEIKNGQLQVSGLVQPYIKNYEKIAIVIDTMSTSTVDIKSYIKADDQSVLLITKDAFTAYDAQNKSTKTQIMKDIGDYKTDRAEILKKADVFFSTKMIWIATVISFVVLFLFATASNLLNVLFFSFLFYTIAKQQKLTWKFKEVFTVGLFTVTFPLILSQMATTLYLNWVFVLVYASLMYFVVLKKDKVV
jgi:hypothetical protein